MLYRKIIHEKTEYLEKATRYLLYAVMLCLPSYLLRLEWFGVRTNILDTLLLLGALFFVVRLWTEKKGKHLFSMIQRQSFFFTGVLFLLLGVVYSAYMSEGISPKEWGILKSWFFLPFLFAFLFYVFYAKNTKVQNTAILLYVWSSGVLSLVFLILSLASYGMTYDDRLKGWYDSPNQLALFLAPAVLFLWTEMRRKQSSQSLNFRKFGTYFGFMVTSTTLLLTESLGGILSLLGGIILYEYTRSRFFTEGRMHIFFKGFLLFFVFLGIFFFFAFEKHMIEINPEDRSSLSSRFMIWQSAWDIGKESWLWGIGPGNFQEKYLEYQTLYPPYLEWAVPHPHNIFLSFWLQSGFLGFLGFVIICGWTLFRMFLSVSQRTNKKELELFLIGFLFLTLLWGLVDTPYWRNDLSVLFWMMLFSNTFSRTPNY